MSKHSENVNILTSCRKFKESQKVLKLNDFECFTTWETVCPECDTPLICTVKPEGFVICDSCYTKIPIQKDK